MITGETKLTIQMMADGLVLEGTPREIVREMFMVAFCPEGTTPAGYIDWAVEQARRMLGVELVVEGEGEDARAASFVEAMLGAKLAVRM